MKKCDNLSVYAMMLISLATLISGRAFGAAQGFVSYSTGSYSQDFNTLPFTSGTAVNAASPITIGNVAGNPTTATTFTLPAANTAFSLSNTALGAGGIAIAPGMDGWYSLGVVGNKLGAHEGSQTTGGLISFGGLTSSDRAVGLGATSSTGITAFGLCLKNTSGGTLNQISLSFTGAVWRQSNLPKKLTVTYFVDTTNSTPAFPTGGTTVSALTVQFPTVPADTGGVAVDGTLAANQQALSTTNLAVGSWGNNQYLWLVWTIDTNAGTSQELAIDNLAFSASLLVHVAPVIANFGPSATYATTSQSQVLAATATISSSASNFNTGNLTVTVTAGAKPAEDMLSIANVGTGAGQIGVNGSNVTFGGTLIGTFAGGTNGAPLVVTLNAAATPAATQALLQNVTYKNVGAPATLASRTITATVDDGSGVAGSTSTPANLTLSVVSGSLAVNDTYSTTANTALTVSAANGIFANDSGFGSPLQVIVNSNPAHGTVALNGADGSFVYTPANGFTGTDTFTYTVNNAVQLWKTNVPPLGVVGGVTITGGGYGSSLCPVPGSPNEYYGLTDRGPNVGGPGGVKIEPIPTFAPAIGKFKFQSNGIALLEQTIPLSDAAGNPFTGRANSIANTGETIVDINGNVLPPNASGYDSEGLAALADGTFWVSDEYGPFITHFDATGKQIARLSPYDGSLPAELAVRVPNKGMEGLTVTPDGSMLVGIMQNALQQPDLPGGAASDPTTIVINRIVTYTFATGALHEYIYPMEGKFGVSEITAVTNSTFIVDERDGKFVPNSTKKLFLIDLTGASDVGPSSPLIGTSNFTFSATTTGGGFEVNGVTLETLCYGTTTGLSKSAAVAALTTAGLATVNKTAVPALDLAGLLVNLDALGRFFSHDKVEGVAVLNNGHKLVISNDSDFGITDSTSTVPPYALTIKTSPASGLQDDGEFLQVNLDLLPTSTATATVTITIAPLVFTAVSAGDVTATDVILWTHVQQAVPAAVTAQVTTDFNFGTFQSISANIDPAQDYTVKVNPTGLKSGMRYYYRFVGANGELSNVGTFKTAYDPSAKVPVHFGFSGDCDGQWRPFPSVVDIGTQSFDFFEFCGDTMYENAISTPFGIAPASPAVVAPEVNLTQCLAGLRRKYLENISPVSSGGDSGLKNFFAAQANYTLLDNHELCSNIGTGGINHNLTGAYQCGGAPQPGAGAVSYNPADSTRDINLAGPFTNKTPEFMACQQAFRNYEPIREHTVVAPTDPRSDGTQQMYLAQQWGKNMVFIHTDDRSYADQRMSVTTGRADNAQRTRLGATQLAWLEQQLLSAQNAGTTWKIVVVSDPIDQIGPVGGSLTGADSNLTTTDGSKSWMGGYRAERNNIMKYIADNKIQNVVFLATDDHTNRVNELLYVPDPVNAPTVYANVPGNCFMIVCGPIGASGPEKFTDHTFATIKGLADGLANAQKTAGVNPVGLDPAYPGLHNVVREGDAGADTNRAPVDFFCPDTFNYSTLDISADGKTLSVATIGLNSYAPNLFEEPATAGPVRTILSFQVDAYVNPVTLTTSPASGAVNAAIPLTISASLLPAQFQPTLQILASTLPTGATVSAGTLSNGVYTLTPAQLTSLTITVPTAGAYSLTIKANALDGAGLVTGTQSATLALNVSANQPPVATNGSIVATGTTAANGTLVASDPDGEAVTISIVTNGTKGVAQVTNAATGAFKYTATNNVAGSDSFTFKATNANGTSNTATETVAILLDTIANPVTISATVAAGAQRVAIPLSVTTALTNPALQATISVAITGVPTGATLSAGTLSNGTYTLTMAQLAGLTVTSPTAGTFPLTYTATGLNAVNQSLGTATATANLVVTANQAPVANSDSIIVTGTVPFTSTLIATDAEKDPLTYTIVANGTKGVATITNAATGAFTYTAASNNFALDSFTFSVSDGVSTSNVATVSVVVVQQIVTPTAVVASISGGLIAPASVAFDGSASTPGITGYSWDFGDGSIGTGATPLHTYVAAGVYTVKLVVTNGAGSSAPATTTVVVAGATLSGRFGRSGLATLKYELTLPAGIPVGTTANLTIGSFTATFANLTSGRTIRSSGNTLKINGSVLSFTLKADSAKLFGTPVPKTGSKIVPVTYNGNAFTETISFTTKGATTTFK